MRAHTEQFYIRFEVQLVVERIYLQTRCRIISKQKQKLDLLSSNFEQESIGGRRPPIILQILNCTPEPKLGFLKITNAVRGNI